MSQKTEKPSVSDHDGLVKFVSWTPYIAGGILLVLVAAYVFAFYQNGWSKNPDAWGQLGDYIGGLLNPLVACFALIALVASVRLQKAELAATREELKESKQAMQEQAKIAEQQRSEQRFFDLLNIYKFTLDNQNFSQHVASGRGQTLEQFIGKEAISNIYLRAESSLDTLHLLISNNENISLDDIRYGLDAWDDDLTNLCNKIPAYSRVVLLIIKIISEDININKNYGDLFLNQLTQEELSVIAIYIIFNDDAENYINIINTSRLFSRMDDGVVSNMINKFFSKTPPSQNPSHAD